MASEAGSDSCYSDDSTEYEIYQTDILVAGKRKYASIEEDISGFPFSDEVKKAAINLSQELLSKGLSIAREGRRKDVVFYCLYQSLLPTDEALSPKLLADIIKYPKSSTQKALSKISKYDTTNSVCIVKSKNFIKQLMKLMKINDDRYDDIVKIVDEVEDKIDDYPQNTATGIIFYYLTKVCREKVKKEDYATRVEMSVMTINGITDQIEKILNP